MPLPIVRRALIAALTCVVLAVPMTGPAEAAGPPSAPVALSGELDPLARYQGQVSCDPHEKPGTRALADLVYATYRAGGRGSITRTCDAGSVSEHQEGRAWDWMLDVNDPAENAVAQSFLSWLTGYDAQGVYGGNARRLGVMYVIRDRRIWKAYTSAVGWYDYTGASPHSDHIHISLSWDGAMKRTSFWTGKAVQQVDVGPCRAYSFRWAPAYTGPRYEPCPKPRTALVSYPRSWNGDQYPDLLGLDANGNLSLSSGPLSRASTRRVGSNWTEVDLVTTIGDFDGDARPDLVARHPGTGDLLLYAGDGTGGFRSTSRIGTSWNGMDLLVGAGDWTGDRAADLLARQQGSSDLFLYPGTGSGRFTGGVPIGRNWGEIDELIAAGDMDGDGRPDMLGRVATTGDLYLYSGNGAGGFKDGRRVGTGWGGFVALVAPGDVDRDGAGDVIGVTPEGAHLLYSGDGRGGWLGSSQLELPPSGGWVVR